MALTQQDLQQHFGNQNPNFGQQMGQAAGYGSLASGIGGLFGGNNNPANDANKYLNQIPGQTNQYYQPYFDAGKGQLPGLSDQYSQLMNNPGGKLNDIGGSFQQSPGFKFALEQALGAQGRAAAAGGMAGSPMHQQQNMELATNLGNQDYYNYLNHATGLYGEGLQGGQNMAGMGQQAGSGMADAIQQQLAQQAQLAYAGRASKNASNPFGNIFGGLGVLKAFGGF